MAHYVKWVRYFCDYESKYGDGATRTQLIDGFLEKLASKGQSGGLCEQARRAVEIFLGMGAGEGGPGLPEDRAAMVAEPPGNYSSSGGRSKPSVPVKTGSRRDWKALETGLVGEIKRLFRSCMAAGCVFPSVWSCGSTVSILQRT